MPAKKRKKNTRQKRSGFSFEKFSSKSIFVYIEKFFKRTLLGLVGVLFFGVLVSLLMGVWFWSQKQWNGQNRANVLLVSNEGEVELFSYEDNSATVLKLGSEVMVKTVHGYGNYRLGVLPKLGKQDGYGYELLSKTVESWLGVNILGVVQVDELPDLVSTKKLWQEFAYRLIFSNKSTVSVGDRLSLWWSSRKLGSGDVYFFDLTDSGVYVKEKLADGASVFIPDEVKLKNLVGLRLYDSFVVARPDAPVAVVNTTGRAGLARDVANQLASMGYDVVSVSDQDEELDDTEVLTDLPPESEEYKYFLSPVEMFFDKKAEFESGTLEKYRSRVVVKLGMDYLRLLEEK